MNTLQIRNVPQDVYEALALRARAEHRSLAQQALVELSSMPELAAKKRRMEVLDEIRRELEATGTRKLFKSPAELIREDRDR